MSHPQIDDKTLILRYFSGELNVSMKEWVESRVEKEPEFKRLFELYKPLEENDSTKQKPSTMTNIRFSPPDHKRPKPRNGVLIFLVVLLIIVLAIMLLL